MRLPRCFREHRFAIVACATLVCLALWLPLSATAALVTWGCALGLAGASAAARVLGRLG